MSVWEQFSSLLGLDTSDRWDSELRVKEAGVHRLGDTLWFESGWHALYNNNGPLYTEASSRGRRPQPCAHTSSLIRTALGQLPLSPAGFSGTFSLRRLL